MIPTNPPNPFRLPPLRRRLEGWRRTRTHARSPIPKALWAGAVAVARSHGLYQTSRALRLDYATLKRHVEAAEAGGAPTRPLRSSSSRDRRCRIWARARSS